MRTKRILRTLRREKEKLDRESEKLGNVIAVLEGRPEKKRFRHSRRGRARISAAKREWWKKRKAILQSSVRIGNKSGVQTEYASPAKPT
jgi:hypothetical protein